MPAQQKNRKSNFVRDCCEREGEILKKGEKKEEKESMKRGERGGDVGSFIQWKSNKDSPPFHSALFFFFSWFCYLTLFLTFSFVYWFSDRFLFLSLPPSLSLSLSISLFFFFPYDWTAKHEMRVLFFFIHFLFFFSSCCFWKQWLQFCWKSYNFLLLISLLYWFYKRWKMMPTRHACLVLSLCHDTLCQ